MKNLTAEKLLINFLFLQRWTGNVWNNLELYMQHETAVGHQKADTLQKKGQNWENQLPEEISFTTWEHYVSFKFLSVQTCLSLRAYCQHCQRLDWWGIGNFFSCSSFLEGWEQKKAWIINNQHGLCLNTRWLEIQKEDQTCLERYFILGYKQWLRFL